MSHYSLQYNSNGRIARRWSWTLEGLLHRMVKLKPGLRAVLCQDGKPRLQGDIGGIRELIKRICAKPLKP